MTGFGFLKDINGDKCIKTLMGMIIGFFWLLLCITCVLYGLSNLVVSSNLITDVLWSMAAVSAVLLGVTAFQKIRDNKCSGKNE